MVILLCCLGFTGKTESCYVIGKGCFGIEDIPIALILNCNSPRKRKGGVSVDLTELMHHIVKPSFED